MAKYTEFYRGRRKRRNYALIPSLLLLGILSVTVVLFYSLQKYAVLSKDGVEIVLPILEEEGKVVVDSEGHEQIVFPTVEATIKFEEPDYSGVKAQAGKHLQGVRAIFVPAGDINVQKLDEYYQRLKSGNALLLEMKPRSGNLMWNTNAGEAKNYGMAVSTEITNIMPQMVEALKEKDVYVAAQISCCIDELYASRCTSVALRTAYGSNYMDVNGTWLDPYNANLRNYVVEMCRELFAMGFDEVVLADVAHPVLPADDEGKVQEIAYTRAMSTTPSPINAVCGFAMYVADQLRDVDGVLSIYCDSKTALAKPDTANGQDAELFFKLYDRVYLPTDKFAYTYNLQDVEGKVSIGKAEDRLVPVVINYLPDNSSWILVDQEEETDD